MKKTVLFLALGILLSACGSSGSANRVAFTATKSGSSVLLELRNRTADPIGFNLCRSVLQRRVDGSWLIVPVEDEVCTMQIETMQPGGSANITKTLPAHLAAFGPGEYRYTTRVEQPAGTPAVDVASNSFPNP